MDVLSHLNKTIFVRTHCAVAWKVKMASKPDTASDSEYSACLCSVYRHCETVGSLGGGCLDKNQLSESAAAQCTVNGIHCFALRVRWRRIAGALVWLSPPLARDGGARGGVVREKRSAPSDVGGRGRYTVCVVWIRMVPTQFGCFS